MKKKHPSIINCKNNKEFECMKQDAKLLYSLLNQQTKGYYGNDDYLWPGCASGQSKLSALEEICKSIQNHIRNFNDNSEILM